MGIFTGEYSDAHAGRVHFASRVYAYVQAVYVIGVKDIDKEAP